MKSQSSCVPRSLYTHIPTMCVLQCAPNVHVQYYIPACEVKVAAECRYSRHVHTHTHIALSKTCIFIIHVYSNRLALQLFRHYFIESTLINLIPKQTCAHKLYVHLI